MHLSKSQYIRGLQCHKALWLVKNRRELIPAVDAQKQQMFDTGHEVGELAKQLFPGGVDIVFEAGDFQGMIDQTAAAIANGADVIYEASFRAEDVFIMADILVRNGTEWDLYEVKASTRVKPYHQHDAAIQWFVLNSLLAAGKAQIVHVNTAYVLERELDLHALMAIEDISETVAALQPGIAAKLGAMAAMLDGDEPAIPIGLQCNEPYECDFKSYCWAAVPVPSVFDLYRMSGEQKFELYHQGRVTYADVQDLALSPAQAMQVQTGLSGEAQFDAPRIGQFLASAQYPINFLDFETFSSAVPRFDGQQAYRAVPFQYSLHILHEDGELEHREFLADENDDPRAALATQLLEDISATGSIVAFNKGFEQSVIRALADRFAPQADALRAMNTRFIDLIDPFRQLMYYHPEFNGSFSIKSVLPAMFPDDEQLDYKALDIRDGEAAMGSYANLHKIDDAAERRRVRDALLAYCALDTLAMVAIWRKLASLVE